MYIEQNITLCRGNIAFYEERLAECRDELKALESLPKPTVLEMLIATSKYYRDMGVRMPEQAVRKIVVAILTDEYGYETARDKVAVAAALFKRYKPVSKCGV